MEFGIVGLELSGKSTLFTLLTGHTPAPGRREAHVGVAQVPDPRLDRLSALFKPRKHTPATVRFVDVPGIVKGGTQSLNLPELRTMDAVAAVVRGFESPAVPHPEGSVDPARDIELLETEMLLADLAVITSRLERLGREAGKRNAAELAAERDALERCRAAIEASTPLRAAGLDADQERLLRGFTFLSSKPMLVVLNASEDASGDLEGALERSGLSRWRSQPRVACSAVCATLEDEISRLDAADQAAFLAELGLPDRALDRLLRAAYELTGLISFFTVGEDECRAWSVPSGTPAVRAAGTIHSDFERGFIRAEVVPWEELVAEGSLAGCRAKARLRLEGRDYVVHDGDVITFRFNV